MLESLVGLQTHEDRRRSKSLDASRKARDREVQRRRTERVKGTAKATMAEREKMMVVVNLEDLL
jgi:hypothetical protein